MPTASSPPARSESDDALPYRFVGLEADLEAPGTQNGVVTALIVDMTVYSPQCEASAEVERWHSIAGE